MSSSREPSERSIGQRVRIVRLGAGLSQREVAEVLHVPRPAVSLLESGKRGMSADELRAFVVATGTSPYYLLSLAEDGEVPGV